MKELSLAQRLMADTPAFFKKVHVIGLMLVGLAVTLSQYPAIPAKVALIAGVAGGTLSLLSLFAVKDVAAIQGAASPESGALQLLPDLLDQFTQIKGVIESHSAAHGETLQSIAGSLATLASPAPDQAAAAPERPAPEATVKNIAEALPDKVFIPKP